MERFIYTLVRAAEWRLAEAAGEYAGSADDARDGFLHFSAAGQVRGSAAKHRAGVPDLMLVEGLDMAGLEALFDGGTYRPSRRPTACTLVSVRTSPSN